MITFSFPGSDTIGRALATAIGASVGRVECHVFPDGETLVRVRDEVFDQSVVAVMTLDRPDAKILPLMFFCDTVRELGARDVILVAPYLPYMRQDTRFHEGEAVSATSFARILSSRVDRLITVDPHLHRRHTLEDLYGSHCAVAHAAPAMAAWIAANVRDPIVIGPDAESAQWVADVADRAGAPHAVLHKEREGDRAVRIALPDDLPLDNRTPVLVDDIISTAATMAEAARLVRARCGTAPVCVGVHAVFTANAARLLADAGVTRIATCNTITHPTNAIDVTPAIAAELTRPRDWK